MEQKTSQEKSYTRIVARVGAQKAILHVFEINFGNMVFTVAFNFQIFFLFIFDN